jgi:hypothetical protein
MPIDPVKVTQAIRESYTRYLTSTFRLRDGTLRKLFHQRVDEFPFTSGPILEATPPFRTDRYVKDLINEKLLNKTFVHFIYDSLPYLQSKPLYLHQEKTLKKILNVETLLSPRVLAAEKLSVSSYQYTIICLTNMSRGS